MNIVARWGWVVNGIHRPLYPQRPVPTVQEAWWFPGPAWTCAENLVQPEASHSTYYVIPSTHLYVKWHCFCPIITKLKCSYKWGFIKKCNMKFQENRPSEFPDVWFGETDTKLTVELHGSVKAPEYETNCGDQSPGCKQPNCLPYVRDQCSPALDGLSWTLPEHSILRAHCSPQRSDCCLVLLLE